MKTATRFISGWCLAALMATLLISGAPAPARAESCTELIANGGFETDDAWVLGVSPVMPQYVTYTRHSGNRALALGITSGANVASYSSARQTVTIPGGATQATLTFWFYAMASSPAATDYMELVLLDATGAAILAKPWQSHNDSRLWNQLAFDLTPWRGQTVQVYFNVYNDGLGGTAALFLDDVSLQACTGGTPAATSTTAPSGTPAATFTPAASVTPGPTPTPGCITAVVNGGFESGLASWEPHGDPRGIALSASAPHSGSMALRLGALDQSINDYTSVRQQVTIPAGFSQVKLEFWTYTFLEANPGSDYQRAELLTTAGNPLVVLWNEATGKQAWERQEVDLAAYAGQTVFLRFGVNNDGSGGRAAMYLDDVLIRACNPAPTATVAPTATGTPVPTGTVAATATTGPTGVPPTYTTVPPGCVDLLHNGGFESGLLPWRAGANLLPAAVVDAPVFEGSYAVRLGSQHENRDSYSSIRQTVTVPWGRPYVLASFWAYTWAESLAGADRQQFVVLGTDDTVLARPWSVLEDAGGWQQYVFDLAGMAGQTFDLYFNAYNDGVGGRTALFVDKVQLWGCTPGEYPAEWSASEASWRGDADSRGGETAARPATAPDLVLPLPRVGEFERPAAAATPWGEMTRVAIAVTVEPAIGRVSSPPPPSAADKLTLLDKIKAQLRQPWVKALALIAIVVSLFLLLMRAFNKGSGS